MASKRRNGRAYSMPAGIAMGIGTALAVSAVGAMLLAWLIMAQRIGEDAIGWGCMVILPLASAAGCGAAWGAIRHRRLMVTGLSALGYYLSLLAIGLLFGGAREGLGITALMIALGGGIALIPAFLGSGSGARKHKIPAIR